MRQICFIRSIFKKEFFLSFLSGFDPESTVIPKRSHCFDLWVLLDSRQSSQSGETIVIFMIYSIMKQNWTVHRQHANCYLHALLLSPSPISARKGTFSFPKNYIPVKAIVSLINHCFREEGNSRVYCLVPTSDNYSSFLFIAFVFW